MPPQTPMPFIFVFATNLALAPSFPNGKDQLNQIGVDHREKNLAK